MVDPAFKRALGKIQEENLAAIAPRTTTPNQYGSDEDIFRELSPTSSPVPNGKGKKRPTPCDDEVDLDDEPVAPVERPKKRRNYVESDDESPVASSSRNSGAVEAGEPVQPKKGHVISLADMRNKLLESTASPPPFRPVPSSRSSSPMSIRSFVDDRSVRSHPASRAPSISSRVSRPDSPALSELSGVSLVRSVAGSARSGAARGGRGRGRGRGGRGRGRGGMTLRPRRQPNESDEEAEEEEDEDENGRQIVLPPNGEWNVSIRDALARLRRNREEISNQRTTLANYDEFQETDHSPCARHVPEATPENCPFCLYWNDGRGMYGREDLMLNLHRFSKDLKRQGVPKKLFLEQVMKKYNHDLVDVPLDAGMPVDKIPPRMNMETVTAHFTEHCSIEQINLNKIIDTAGTIIDIVEEKGILKWKEEGGFYEIDGSAMRGFKDVAMIQMKAMERLEQILDAEEKQMQKQMKQGRGFTAQTLQAAYSQQEIVRVETRTLYTHTAIGW